MRKLGKMENRIIAGCIDGGVTVVIAIIFMYAAAGICSKPAKTFEILVPVVYFLYLLMTDMLAEGQSLGRKLVKECIMGKGAKAPSKIDYIVRDIIKTMPVLVIFLFPTLRIFTICVAVAYLLFPFFHKKHLAIHDLVAETKVCANAWECVDENRELPQKAMEPTEEKIEENIELQKSHEVRQEEVILEEQECEQESIVKPGIFGVDGVYEDTFIPLTKEIIFGRGHDCNLVFPEDTLGISRRHCMVQYDKENEMFFIIDLNSTYGTFLGDGSKIPSQEKIYLQAGEEFFLGGKEKFRVGYDQ